jgi:hypothetical protein
MIAPAALALITTTFPEGQPRNRAMGVYAAMSVAGGAVGLITGGLLTTYASWRRVLFVNVPIGLAAALAVLRVLPESPRQPGRFDLPGAITGTGAIAALVYGLSSAATSPDGVSHGGDAKVVASLAASVVLLAAFAVIETRSKRPLLPVRLLADRNRTGANLVMLCIGTAIFGMFFFLTRVPAVRLGILGAEDRRRLPAADGRNPGGLRRRRPARPGPVEGDGRRAGHAVRASRTVTVFPAATGARAALSPDRPAPTTVLDTLVEVDTFKRRGRWSRSYGAGSARCRCARSLTRPWARLRDRFSGERPGYGQRGGAARGRAASLYLMPGATGLRCVS